MPSGAEAVDPEEEIPSGQEFLCQLPEQKGKAEEKAPIITTLDSISEAQAHMSMVTANLSSLVIDHRFRNMGVPNGTAKYPTLILETQ